MKSDAKFIANIFKYKKELLQVSFVIFALFLMVYFIYQESSAKPKPKDLEEKLKVLCKEIPPDFQQWRSPRSFEKLHSGTYGIGFSSRMTYKQVKDFYSEQLLPKGWRIDEDSKYNISDYSETRYLSFDKDEYSINLETASLNEDDSEKLFFVNCSWVSH